MKKRYAGVVAKRGGKRLLVRESSSRGGLWSLPGGHVREGETFAGAAEREFFEETGMRVTLYKGTLTTVKPIVVCQDSERIGIAFVAEIICSMEQWPNLDEIVELMWFEEEDIHDLFFEGQLKHPGWNLRLLVNRINRVELVFLWAHDRGETPTFWGLDSEEVGCLIRNWHNLHL